MTDMPLPRPNLSAVVRKISSISTLPHIAFRILQLTSDHKSSASDLEEVIRSDPSLTAKLLKMANSAHFSLREPVIEVKKAVVFLGFKVVKDLALSASVCDLFKSSEEIGTYTRVGLWKHSVAVAICSKLIAQKTDTRLHDNVFSTGILHDIGIVMIDQYLHDYFVPIMKELATSKQSIIEIENSVLGFTHEMLAQEVVGNWKLPAEFLATVSAHHTPSKSDLKHRQLVAISYLANTLICARGVGFAENKAVDPKEFNVALTSLNFQKTDIQLILEELPKEFEKAKEFMELVDGK